MRQHTDDVEFQYQAPMLAKLLHSLPHYNITFHLINSTFRPKNEVYVESLGILGSVPAALLIVSLFGLLLYLLTRCCDRKPRPAHSITSLKVTLTVVTVLCCSAIGLGLYGNDDLHNGLLEVLQAGRIVDSIVSGVRNQTMDLESTLSQKIRPQLVELADIFDNPISNQTALSQLLISLNIVQGNVTVATNAAGDIRRPLMGVTMTGFLAKGDQWELIRWPGTVAVLALLLVLCAVLLVGVARHSRCALILFSVCGLLAVTGSWLMSGLYLSTSVAVGDLCMDPADYLVSEAPSELPTEVLLYYTQCEMARSNPFTQRLRESQNAIVNARTAMGIVSKISLVQFKSAGLQPKLGAVHADLINSERLLQHLTTLVDCKSVHHSYINATKGLCEGGLLGLVLMLVASFAAAILLTIMVWVDSHTWIYIRNRHDYAQVEEPSYVSHQQMQQAHHHQQQAMMARTLPRNHHQKGPPVISGSHTLQHPRHKQNEMMAAHHHAQQQQQQQHSMRPMGTHTLGRLPSHNHSPSHHGGGMANGNHKNACTDTGPSATTAHPNHHQHQQQAQHPQQQSNNYHPALDPSLPGYPHHGQIPPQANYATHPNFKNQQQQPPTQTFTHSQPPPPSIAHQNPNSIYGQNQNHYTTHQPQQPAPARIYQQQNPYGTTMRRHPAPGHQPMPPQVPRDYEPTPIPGSHLIDGALYERDKQIYRCSTMRPSTGNVPSGGGRYENGKSSFGAKPSILNCPLPAIPTETNGDIDRKEKSHYSMSRTLGRPMKNPGKPILPPIIAEAPRPPVAPAVNSDSKLPAPPPHMLLPSKQDLPLPSPPQSPPPPASPLPPPSATNTSRPQQAPSIQQTPSATLPQSANSQPENDAQKAPPPSGVNPNDDSNYAVTEL